MKRLDLIVDALRIANFEGSNPFPNKATKDIYAQAFAYVRELRDMKPVCWVTPDGEGWRMRFDPPVNDVPLGWTPLYALDEVNHGIG